MNKRDQERSELRVLVTGGSGFIGTNLVDHFRSRGASVVNFDSHEPRDPRHRGLWVAGDIVEPQQLSDVVGRTRPHLVLHCAARTDLMGRNLADYTANTTGISNLLAALAVAPEVRRVVFCSSMLVCRLGYQPLHDQDYHPDTVYGESKVAGERLVREAGPVHYSWAIVRPTSIWGPWFSVPYRNFFDTVRSGWYVHPRGCDVRRSYGFVLNAVQQIAAIADAPAAPVAGRTFYIADYEPLDVLSWANDISAASGRPAVKEVPLAFLRVAALAGEVLQRLGYRSPPLTRFRLRNMLTSAVYDLSSTQAVCPRLPYSRQAGVRLTIEWLDGARGRSRAAPQQEPAA